MEDSLYIVMQEKNSRVAKWLLSYFGREPLWEDLTPVNLKKFNEYLQEHLSINSVKTYIAELRSVINLYREEKDIPVSKVNLKTVLKTKSVKSTNCYLTIEELERIGNLTGLNEIQRNVRDMFLLQAWCGCRLSDAITLTAENIDGEFLSYTSQKTRVYTSVPIKPLVRDIVRRMPEIKLHNTMTYNRTVHRLCKMAGITQQESIWRAGKRCTAPKYELISSHSARRSFATNLYEAGIEIGKISYMMGHTDTAMTERYICSNMEINDDIRDFFK